MIYSVTCAKDSGQCSRVQPQYVGKTKDEAKHRLSEHVGTVTQHCHSATTAPVGVHFRGAGHSAADIRFLPFEKLMSKDPFILAAREEYWIEQYEVVEKGLNKKRTKS